MKKIEQSIADGLAEDSEIKFDTSDDELFKRAVSTANTQQGSKDLLALGMASIWVVFASIFINILKPAFKNMANENNKKNTGVKNEY